MTDGENVKVGHITTIDMSLRYLLLNQLQSLQEAGYQITGVSSSGPDVPLIEAAGIPHVAVPISRNLTPLADLVSLLRLYRLMRQHNFTIVHTHNPKPGLLGQIAARMARTPIVINTLHGLYLHDAMHPAVRRFYITLEKIAARCSDAILSQNKEDMETALREQICPPERIRHLGNGIDLDRFNPSRVSEAEIRHKRLELGVAADEVVVGYVGRLAARRKGIADLMTAGQLLIARHPKTRFLIVGAADPGKSDAVEPSYAARYGLAQHCLFPGYLPNEILPAFYGLMDVFVLPSLYEGFPRAIMEASAMGVPVVATDVKGNREAVQDGITGFLVPYGHPQQLAAAIDRILGDPDLARQLGEAGRRLAVERFDERSVFATVRAEYVRLLQEKGLPIPHQALNPDQLLPERRSYV